MPNWCEGVLKIRGTKPKIAKYLYGAAVNRKRRALQADLDHKTSRAGRIETYYDVIRRGDLKHLRGDRA